LWKSEASLYGSLNSHASLFANTENSLTANTYRVTQKSKTHKSLNTTFNFNYSSFLFQVAVAELVHEYCKKSFSHPVLINQREVILRGGLFR